MQEAFDVELTDRFAAMLEQAQQAAKDADARQQGAAVLDLSGATYTVRARGTVGFRWVLECDDYLILIASPGTHWPVSIRYLAAGLWEHGVDTLRERALSHLHDWTKRLKPRDWQRVSRADYAWDFYSPAFSAEFRAGSLQRLTVAPSGVKHHEKAQVSEYGKGERGETYTIGTKSGLQVEVYDKTLEIDEKSGKTWMHELWAENADGEIFETDVWRLEVRMSSDWLKERNIQTPGDLERERDGLLKSALYARRITVPTSDSNKRRWPVHPLWSEAIRRCGTAAMPPVGRMLTGRRDALVDQLEKQLMGTLRSLSALARGGFDEEFLRRRLEGWIEQIPADPEHREKLEQALLRYRNVEEAR